MWRPWRVHVMKKIITGLHVINYKHKMQKCSIVHAVCKMDTKKTVCSKYLAPKSRLFSLGPLFSHFRQYTQTHRSTVGRTKSAWVAHDAGRGGEKGGLRGHKRIYDATSVNSSASCARHDKCAAIRVSCTRKEDIVIQYGKYICAQKWTRHIEVAKLNGSWNGLNRAWPIASVISRMSVLKISRILCNKVIHFIRSKVSEVMGD